MPIDDIATTVGCSVEMVYRTVAELQLPSRAVKQFEWPPAMVDRAKYLYENGKAPKGVAHALTTEFGTPVDAKTVSNRASRDKWSSGREGGYRGQHLKARALGPLLPDRPMPKLRPDPVPHPSAPKILIDVGPHECKFPQGEAPGGRSDMQLYCCEPRLRDGGPHSEYCRAHTFFVYPRWGK